MFNRVKIFVETPSYRHPTSRLSTRSIDKRFKSSAILGSPFFFKLTPYNRPEV